MNNKQWKIEKRKLKDLKLLENNPRTITETDYAQLKKDLELGKFKPFVIDNDGVILAGNQTYRVLLETEGIDSEWDCSVPQFKLTESQRKKIILLDNRHRGVDDIDMLANEFEDELRDLGFDDILPEEIAEIEEDDYEATDEIETDIQVGDVFQLGEHRLMCGDATKIESVEKLMDGNKADMVFTDPPYGIDEKTSRGDRKQTFVNKPVAAYKEYDPIIGDDSFDTAIGAFSLIATLSIKNVIYWGGNCFGHLLPQSFSWIVWDKKVEDKNKDNQGDCELAWVSSSKFKRSTRIFRHVWKGMIKDSEHGQARVHPTQKPIALAEWCFKNYGDPAAVLDLFGGSGSTLIACEQTNRKCYMMELDPKYCWVIIDRWEKFTSKKAKQL